MAGVYIAFHGQLAGTVYCTGNSGGLLAAGAVAEAVAIRNEHPEIDIKAMHRKIVRSWRQKIQGPSNVSLLVGMVGMLKKIRGSEAAFIAGAIGTVLSLAPDIMEKLSK